MEVKVLTCTDEQLEDRDGDAIEIYINGSRVFDVGDGEPEDNTLSRNFNDCYAITNMIQSAFTAGQEGECLTITRGNIED